MLAAVYPTPQSGVLLCIDDNEDVLECEKSFLESFGYCVLTAASGGKGLELASRHSVDVVILDYYMPEMNGQEVAIEMRRSHVDDSDVGQLSRRETSDFVFHIPYASAIYRCEPQHVPLMEGDIRDLFSLR